MFIATVHKAERKTVVESTLVSSVIGIQSKGFSSSFLPFPWGPRVIVPAQALHWLVFSILGVITLLFMHYMGVCTNVYLQSALKKPKSVSDFYLIHPLCRCFWLYVSYFEFILLLRYVFAFSNEEKGLSWL